MKVEPDPLVPDVYLTVRGQVYLRQTRWGPVVQQWPRPRGTPKHAGQRWRQVEFGLIAAATKNVNPQDYGTAVAITKKTNLVPRDVLMLAMMGNLFEIRDETGQVWKGWRFVVSNVQDVLEQLTSTPGALPVRGNSFWEWISPGSVGEVLTYTLTGPEWQPATGGSVGPDPAAYGWATPVKPVYTDFSLEADAVGAPTLTSFAAFGFTMLATAGAGVRIAAFGKAAPTTPTWTVTVGLRLLAKPNLNFFNAGIYLRKSGNTKLLTFGASMRAGSAPISVTRWNSATSFSSDQYSQNNNGIIGLSPIWFRVAYDGTNYVHSISTDGLTFVPVLTQSATAWLPSVADRIGVFVDPENGDTTAKLALTCFDWQTL